MQERRRFDRLETKEKASLNKEGAESEQGQLLDISPGGMRIILEKESSVGSLISGQFKILPNAGPFYVKGEVAWVKPAGERARAVEVGIKFNKISAIPF
jgi:Tfp pilus assembly protein PilZ